MKPKKITHRPYMKLLICSLAGIAFSIGLAATAPKASAAVLFTETFESGTSGQLWNGYNAWSGTSGGTSANIVSANGGLVGHFVASPSSAGVVTKSLGATYSLTSSAYRLSFDVQGDLTRGFNVYLADANNRQVGFRLGNSSAPSDYKVGGYDRTGTTNTYFFAYDSPTPSGVAPANYSSSSFYTVYLDINLTAQDIDIFGTPLAAGKVRLTYNATAVGGMSSYSVTFDPPASMISISDIGVQRAIATSLQYSVDNLQLQSVPEPSAAGLVPAAGGIFFVLKWIRRSKKA